MKIRFNVYPWAQLRGEKPATPKRGRLFRVCGMLIYG